MRKKMPKNPFKLSLDNKRYHTLSYEYKKIFGEKVAKVSLSSRFSCPNRDGTKSFGGCTFCSDSKSGDFSPSALLPIEEQYQIGKDMLKEKWEIKKYIVYFQSATNTHASLEEIKNMLEPALLLPDVLGLSIATRADCITEEIADYFAFLAKKTYLKIELGLESIKDETLRKINRSMSHEEFLKGYNLLKSRHLSVTLHVIFSLPGETKEDMLNTVTVVSKLKAEGIKIHMLYVTKDAPIAAEYSRGEIALLTKEDYVSLVCDALEILPPQMVVERLTGDGDKEKLIAPLWSKNKKDVLNAIDKELLRRNSYQGRLYRELELEEERRTEINTV